MALDTDHRSLSVVARHVVTPSVITGSEWGSVKKTCHKLGWRFDSWQDGAGRLILATGPDGLYAADTTAISIPRQVGKTYLIGCIIFALCLMKPGLTVIWTAHRKTTAAETFAKFDGMAQRPKVAAHILQVLRGKGDEKILFKNRSRILFGSREAGFGRGFDNVDVLVFDEAQMLPATTLEDMAAAQNVAKNPLTFMMGTPPRPKDDGEFFTLLRQEALDGESDGTLYIEMSADRNCDPMDREQWRKANPSFPYRTTERAMLRLRKKLKNDDSWNREALGIWDEIVKQFSPINGVLWGEGVDIGPSDNVKPDGLAVDMSHDRRISVGACWVEGDSAHVEEVWAGVDEAAAVAWVADAWKRAGRRKRVVIDGMSPAASMIPKLKALGVNVHAGTSGDMQKACGLVASEVEAGRLTHADQEAVNDAREGARKRPIGKAGGWGYDREDASVNIAPLVAVTLARLAAASIRTGPTSVPKRVR